MAIESSPRSPRPRPLWAQRGPSVLLLVLLSLSMACHSDSPTSKANVILISIDTLRSDRLGVYGYDRPTSPAMDRFAARGVRFARAIAESSWTLPSHMTLMTGLHPTSHGVTARTQSLGLRIPLLAEVLSDAGYRTYGFTAGGLVGHTWGFASGFEVYEDESRGVDFQRVLRRARETIDGLDGKAPYFLFLHTYDVHCPYDPPDRYQAMFQTMPNDDRLKRAFQSCFNKLKPTPDQFRFVSDLYDAGIRAADDQLGEFLAWLEARGELDDTIVIITSDHGEELGERGNVGHGFQLHIQTLRIPLIIVAPGLSPSVVQRRVGLVDVMPTILDLVGVAAPFSQGETLVPWMRGVAVPDSERAVFSELDRKVKVRSVVHGESQLITDLEGRLPPRFFDLAHDPEGMQPINGAETALSTLLAKHVASLSTVASPREPTIDAVTAERLRALGYGGTEVDSELTSLVRSGSRDAVSELLAAGGDVNARDAKGDTALIIAAAQGDREMAEFLLKKGADANAWSKDGSALVRAAEEGHLEVLKALLEHGAQPNNRGQTPLMAAASRGIVGAMTILIEHGAEVNALDRSDRSALHWAAENGSIEAVQLLLERGADPNAASREGKTPAILAAEKGRARIVSALIEGGADPNRRDANDRTPLLAAVEAENKEAMEVVLALAAAGASLNATNDEGQTALHVAAEEGDESLVEALLRAGADVNATMDEKTTALHIAVDDENEPLVDILLAHGADPNARDEDGETPIDQARENMPGIRLKLEKAAAAR